MEVVNGPPRDQRVTTLVHANEDAVFRDSKVALANNIAIALAVVLALDGLVGRVAPSPR